MFKTLLVDNAILIIQFAVGGLIPLFLIPHIIKSIGLSAYGEIAIGLSWAGYASTIVQYAFHLTGPKYLAQAQTEESRRHVFWNVFAAKVFLYGAVVFAGSALLLLFGNVKFSVSAFLLYSLLPLGSAFHAGWYLQAMGHFGIVSIVSACAAIISLAVGFVFVVTDEDVLVAIASLTVGATLSGLGTFCASRPASVSAAKTISWRESVHYLRDDWSIFFSQFVSALYMMSGPIVIGYFIGTQAAGAYSAVERIVTAITCAYLLTHTAAYPRLALLYHHDRASYRKLMTAVLCIYLVGVLFLCLTAVLAGDLFARFIFGNEYLGYGDLIWWGLVLVFLGIFGPMVTGYLVVSGNQRKVYPLTLKILLVSIVLGIPGVTYFGTWAWFCSLAIAQLLVLWAGFQLLRKRA